MLNKLNIYKVISHNDLLYLQYIDVFFRLVDYINILVFEKFHMDILL